MVPLVLHEPHDLRSYLAAAVDSHCYVINAAQRRAIAGILTICNNTDTWSWPSNLSSCSKSCISAGWVPLA